jgi:glycosyltransferase involved in cell wall biosynthesis
VRALCVGSIEPRKNHERLLDALDLVRSRHGQALKLTLAGGAHGLDPDLAPRVRAKVAGAPDVDWVEQPSDEQIAALYEACDFTVYPSLEEGFGMPILESLWHGKPVLCASFGAMAEVAEGGGCYCVDTTDTAALADALWTLASDPDLRRRLAEEARARSFRSWGDYAREVASRLGLTVRPMA